MIYLCIQALLEMFIGSLVSYTPLGMITSTETKQAISERLLHLSNEIRETINKNNKEKEVH